MAESSQLDPLRIDTSKHDFFPKTSLGRQGWIGDRYPLCVDLPEHSFLRTGVSYLPLSVFLLLDSKHVYSYKY